MGQTVSMSYDHPAYTVHTGYPFPALAAGASGATSKFVAWANMDIYGMAFAVVAAGTSTYTAWNGTATVTGIAADQVSLIRVTNNSLPGVAPSLTTATYGPFAIAPYNGTATGTQTNAAGYVGYISLYGTASTGQAQAGSAAGVGGISVKMGDQLYIQRGTDATAITGITLEADVASGASLGA